MTNALKKERLRGALRDAGSGWILEFWGKDQDKNLDVVLSDLDRFQREYLRRFRDTPDPFALIEENVLKGSAFFQVDTLRLSVEMKVMVWRILLGCEIKRMELQYEAGRSFSLLFVLQPPYSQDDEEYRSAEPSDFRVLRHFGSTGVNDTLFLQGYYALRQAN